MTEEQKSPWVSTPVAEKILGLSRQTLKRAYSDPETGFLKEGFHWRRGRHPNSSRGWHLERCQQALKEQGHLPLADRQEKLEKRGWRPA